MEIERKFLIHSIPFDLSDYSCIEIEQGYLSTTPVLRIRKWNDSYYFTYKSAGLMTREEIELPFPAEAYQHLVPKCDGTFICKSRYQIPEEHGYTIELDCFHGDFEGLVLAEVEFPSEAAAQQYQTPDWFTCEVTLEPAFHNSRMSEGNPNEIISLAKQLLHKA